MERSSSAGSNDALGLALAAVCACGRAFRVSAGKFAEGFIDTAKREKSVRGRQVPQGAAGEEFPEGFIDGGQTKSRVAGEGKSKGKSGG